MTITFCGHSNFHGNAEYEQKIISILEKNVGNSPADIYLGGYGNFDAFAYSCCKKYKQTHPKISLVFTTPYITPQYQKNHLEYEKTRYDSIVYPEIEDKPPKFAITYRNRYMVDSADLVIAYITHNTGGAYATYHYAEKRGKSIINIAIAD